MPACTSSEALQVESDATAHESSPSWALNEAQAAPGVRHDEVLDRRLVPALTLASSFLSLFHGPVGRVDGFE
eukprot:16451288-Heterocapsa_arctica.AAC.1